MFYAVSDLTDRYYQTSSELLQRFDDDRLRFIINKF